MTVVARGVARPPTRLVTSRGLIVPAYFHPAVAADDWQALRVAGAAVRAVIFNVANGPGAVPERELAAAAVATGRPLIGYVDTKSGERPAADVFLDIRRHREWYPTIGVFLDRVAADAAGLAGYRRLVREIRRFGPGLIVLNHGAYPDPEYAALADTMVTFEGSHAAYQKVEVPEWARRLPAARFCHLVYDTPEHLLDETLEQARAHNAGAVYVTDRGGANPWDGLPPYFAAQASAWVG
jgi:hypothetical protein